MIKGETVEVAYLQLGDKDKFGNQERSHSDWQEVENVVSYVSSTKDDIDDGEPHLDRRQATFLFPKSYHFQSLKDAQIRWEERVYKVMGDPHPFPMLMCPTQWNMEVKGVLYE